MMENLEKMRKFEAENNENWLDDDFCANPKNPHFQNLYSNNGEVDANSLINQQVVEKKSLYPQEAPVEITLQKGTVKVAENVKVDVIDSTSFLNSNSALPLG